MMRMQTRYSKFVPVVGRDERHGARSKEEQASLGRKLKEFNMMLVGTSDEHCNS